MYSKIKNEIKEIVQIVNECPESLQEKCFEVLLSHLLMEVSPAEPKENQTEVVIKKAATTKAKKEEKAISETKVEEIKNGKAKAETVMNGEAKKVAKPEPKPKPKKVLKESHEPGIQLADFHSKVQNYLEASSISIERINDIYQKENGSIIPLYKNLGTDQPHVVQICLALLSAFEDSFYTGGFEFDVDMVRARCKETKLYDADNYSQNFENVKQLFKEGAEFNEGSVVKLSPDGLNALSEVLNKVK